MSQQEDDLRALAKIMDFLRAVSIILVVMNVYWFCYEVPFHSLHEAVFRPFACLVLSGYEGCQG